MPGGRDSANMRHTGIHGLRSHQNQTEYRGCETAHRNANDVNDEPRPARVAIVASDIGELWRLIGRSPRAGIPNQQGE